VGEIFHKGEVIGRAGCNLISDGEFRRITERQLLWLHLDLLTIIEEHWRVLKTPVVAAIEEIVEEQWRLVETPTAVAKIEEISLLTIEKKTTKRRRCFDGIDVANIIGDITERTTRSKK
jgi:hypothetical protein